MMRARLVSLVSTLLLPACREPGPASGSATETGTSGGESTGETEGPGEPTSSTGTGTGAPTTGTPTTGEPPPPGAAALFDPLGDWLAGPWPTDHHRSAEGRVDLSRVPLAADNLFQIHLQHGEEVLRGFALSGSVYFPFAGPLDASSLPSQAATVADPDAPVQLVNVSPGSAHYGRRLPLVFRVYPAGADPFLPHDTLALRTLPGIVLAEGEVYCAWVTDGLRDAGGLAVSATPEFVQALASDPVLAPLRAYLEANNPELLPRLVSATCFTTDTATRELVAIQEFLATDPSAPPPSVVETALYQGEVVLAPGVGAYEITGTYKAPKFQAGQEPHCALEDGGGFVFDEKGRPVVQEMETMRFSLLVPDDPAPPGGWPIVLCAHGSGGDYRTCTTGGPEPREEIERGLAVLGIDMPMHGVRGPGNNPWDCLLNPATMRTGLRQAAVDFMSLARAIAAGTFVIDVPFPPLTITFDSEKIYFFGHSLGGLGGSLVLGTVPQIRGGLLSAAGGLTIYSALYRQDWLVFLPMYAHYIGVDLEVLDEHHPALTIVQLLNEPGDPLNYARYWLDPPSGAPAKHVLLVSGDADIQTPPITNLVLAAAGGVPVIEPVLLEGATHAYLGLKPVQMPVTANAADGAATAGLLQVPGDHFVVYTNPQARAARARFFATLVGDGVPTIDTAP